MACQHGSRYEQKKHQANGIGLECRPSSKQNSYIGNPAEASDQASDCKSCHFIGPGHILIMYTGLTLHWTIF